METWERERRSQGPMFCSVGGPNSELCDRLSDLTSSELSRGSSCVLAKYSAKVLAG